MQFYISHIKKNSQNQKHYLPKIGKRKTFCYRFNNLKIRLLNFILNANYFYSVVISTDTNNIIQLSVINKLVNFRPFYIFLFAKIQNRNLAIIITGKLLSVIKAPALP